MPRVAGRPLDFANLDVLKILSRCPVPRRNSGRLTQKSKDLRRGGLLLITFMPYKTSNRQIPTSFPISLMKNCISTDTPLYLLRYKL